MGKANIYCNEIHIDKLARGIALTLLVEPGQYKIQTDLKKDGVVLQVELSKEYYIDISSNTLWGGYYIKKVAFSEAKPFIDELPDKKKKETHFKLLKKKPSKSFFSKAFIKYIKYCSILGMIIAFLVYLGLGEYFLFVFITFLIILAVAAAAYYPVLYIAKTGWKFFSILFQKHFWV